MMTRKETRKAEAPPGRRHVGRAISCLLLGSCLFAGCAEHTEEKTETANGEDYDGVMDRIRTRRDAEENITAVKAALDRFQVDFGRTPTNLLELVRYGYFKELPPLPDGMTYSYSHVIGNLQIVKGRTPKAVDVGEEGP